MRCCPATGAATSAPPASRGRTARTAPELVRIVDSRPGASSISTPEHTHFAGYRLGLTPQLHLTYAMWRRAVGFRVGTSRVYTDGQRKPVVGAALRTRHEHADATWVVSTHRNEAEARAAEALLSLRYQVPTLPFVARPRGAARGLVGDQDLIDDVFARVGAYGGGERLLEDEGLSRDHPHFVPASHDGRRRNLVVTLCGDRRGATPMHRLALAGTDPEARAALEEAGISVRAAKPGSPAWRYESCFKDFGDLLDVVERIRSAVDVDVRHVARLGAKQEGMGASLPFTPASAVRPGMAVFTGDGGYDVVETVERIPLDADVYDLNIEHTHNFVANGLVTHNSIYAFRGADISNILDFQDTFEDARTSGSSRTTAPPRPSSASPTRSSRTTAGAWPSRCGPTSARVIRSRSARCPTSTPRRATSPARSSGSSTRASRARRSRSSTGPTRSRACSRTRWCGPRSATRSSAARSSTSGPRSRTPSPT